MGVSALVEASVAGDRCSVVAPWLRTGVSGESNLSAVVAHGQHDVVVQYSYDFHGSSRT